MTGSGSAVLEKAVGRFEAELRAVNHRFLKTTVRTAGGLPPLDGVIEKRVKERVHRGHVTVHVRLSSNDAAPGVQVDTGVFTAVAQRLHELARDEKLGPPTVSDVIRFPGVVADATVNQDPEALSEGALEALDLALEAFQAAREREGRAMVEEMGRLLGSIRTTLVAATTRAAELPDAYRERLQGRIRELLDGTGVDPDPAQIVREAASLADRSDVREEIARLEAHLEHAQEVIDEGGPIGRRLDFLVQEMHREVNTIGSKAGDLAMARDVVEMKSDVERLREQVQNLE